MAEELDNTGIGDTSGADQNLQTLDALHLDGKGAPTLEDADERSLSEMGDIRPEDVTGNANVQSAGRTTYERMVQGGIREEPVVPTADHLALDTVNPTFRDNGVAAQFENVQPRFDNAANLYDNRIGNVDRQQSRDASEQMVGRDPVRFPQGQGEQEGAPAAPAGPAAARGTQPPEEPQAEPSGAPTPTTEPTEDEEPIIPKVADAPSVVVAAASGTEDSDTKLNIAIATADRDGGSETISAISISNVPDGFSFVDAAGNPVGVRSGGVWSFTPAQLDNLYLRQPGDYSGDITLTVNATAREANGSTATTSTALNVHVEAVADAPGLHVADSAGMENTLIPLSITVDNNDAVREGAGATAPETQTVYISNLPAGAKLYLGDTAHPITAQVGGAGLTVGGTTIPAGAYVVSAADLPNLKVQSASNDSHDFSLNVWATSTEPSNGDVALTGFQTIQVDVGVNAPSASGSGTGQEGGWANLSLSASVNFPDGTENLRVFIAGLEPGATLAYGDGTPVAVGADGRYEVTGRLDDLKVGWPDANQDKDIGFNLVAEVRDGDTDSDSAAVRAAAPDFASTTVPVTVTIQAVADGPTGLSASGIGVEDKWFDLNVTTGLLDTDGSESLTVTITGPAGFQLASGTDTAHPYTGVTGGDGTVTYTLTQAQLQNLQMRAPADSDADIDLHMVATTTESATGGQVALVTKSLPFDLNVKILSDADKPVVSVIKDTQTINEDGLFDLSKSVTGTFSDGSFTHAAVTGAASEAGSVQGASTSADSSETITYRITANQDSVISLNGVKQAFHAGQTIEVSAADIATGKVQVGGVDDWASSGAHPTLTFSVVTVATERNDATDDALQGSLVREGVRVSDPAVLTIAVNPVADASTATLSVVASGYEDGLAGTSNHSANVTGGGIAVTPTLTLSDLDLSESPTGTVTITSSDAAMLAGSLTVSGTGASIVRVDGVDASGNPTATWTISGGNFTTTAANTFRLDGLVFHPAANNDADPRYDIGVQFQDTNGGAVATVSALNQTISVAAVADAPTLATSAAGGLESASGPALIDLDIRSALTDTDGSETLSVYVTGIPAGAGSLSAYREAVTGDVTIGGVTLHGTAANPVYRLSAADLSGLKLQVAQGYSEDMQLTVYSQTVEANGGDVAISGPATLNVDIGVLAPTIGGSVSGDEDSYTSLAGLVTNRQAGDATDGITVYVEGLDNGATLYKLVGGNYVALAPTTYQDASGASHTGYDVTGLRDGATGALSGVYVKWDAANKADDIHLTLRSVVADTDSDAGADAGGFDRNTAFGQAYADTSEATQAVTVTVRANADAPATLTASAIGVEDKWVALNIASTLADTDGSETLTITVAGVPAGVQLSTGTIVATDANGITTWAIGPEASNAAMQARLSGLRMTNLPANSDADFNIVVRATATETETGAQVGAASAFTEQTINVKILSDADKPVVSVIKDTQTIQEDGWFNLSQSLSGTFSNGSQDSSGTAAALSGASGESPGLTGTVDSADHSETLTYRIKPVEAGSRLAIDVNGDNQIGAGDLTAANQYWNATGGYWEVPAALVNGNKVFVAGKADWASAGTDRLHFDIQTVATETRDTGEAAPAGMTRAQSQVSDVATLTLKVNPVADGAVVTASNSGFEDQIGGIPVSPVLTLSDTDMSERPVGNVSFSSTDVDLAGGHFTLTLNGTTTTITPDFSGGTYTWSVPASAFTASGNTWTLSGLQYFPKAELARDVTYSVTVDTQDVTGGDIRTLPAATGTISVIAVADKPGVQVLDYQGVESAASQDIALNITPVASSDTDGSESMFVYITGLPSGKASLVLANGTTVGASATTSVDGVNFSPNGETVYKVAQADLAGLKLRVVGNYSDDVALKVWSVTEESQYAGQVKAGPGGDVDVFHAVSDPQTLRIDLGVLAPTTTIGTLAGNEKDFIALSNVTTNVTAADGSETIKVFIEDLSNGAQLFSKSGSTYTALTPTTYTDAQGNQHTGYDVTSLRDPATGRLSNVYASWNTSNSVKSTSDANIDLKVRTVVWDKDIDPGHDTANDAAGADAGGIHMETAYGAGTWRDINETVQSATIVVKAVADAATLNGTAAAVEDKWVNLNLTAALNDTDGSENLTLTIAGVPAGLTLAGNTTPVTDVVAADGSHTYTFGPFSSNADIQAALAGLKLNGLGAGAWAETDGSFNLTVTATTTELASGGEVATKTTNVSKTVTVDILSNADTPVVQVESAPQTIAEDAFFSLHTRIGDHFAVEGKSGEAGSVLGASTSADSSETLTFRIKPVEAGSRLAIDVGGDGQISGGDLTAANQYWNAAGGYWEVPAALVNGNKVWVGGAANWASTSDSDNLHFDIRTVATETRDGSATGPADMPRAGVAVSDPLRLTLNVTPVADSTSISLSGSGVEDQVGGIAFTPTIRLADTDGSESLTGTVDILVACKPDGSFPGTLSFARAGMIDGGTETYEGATYHVFRVPATELSGSAAGGYTLSGLTFAPKADSDLDIQYRVRVTTTESANSDAYVTVSSVANLDVAAVADAPILTVGAAGATTDANGVVTVHDAEDGGADGVVRLDLAAQLKDLDGSEVLTNAELRDVPAGWGVITVDANGNKLSSVAGTDSDGDGKFTFVLDPRSVTPGSGISVALVPPANSDVDVSGITFWAKATEVTGAANPNDPGPTDNQVSVPTAERSVILNVQLNPVADTPILQVASARGSEDSSIPLDIRTTVTDADESAMVEITGVPSGGVLTYVNAANQTVTVTFGNGVTALTVTPAEARSLRFTAPEDASGKFSLNVRSISTDVDPENPALSHSTDRTAILDVYVKGVNDEILDQNGRVVNATSGNLTASGVEDAAGNLVSLNLGSYSVADVDHSETLSAVIQGLPSGASLVVKTASGVVETSDYLQYIGKDGHGDPIWSVPPDILQYVYVKVPHDYAGSFDLSVRLITTEADGASTSFDKTLTVTVKPDADPASGSVTGTYTEDHYGADGGIAFSLNAGAGDTDLHLSALGDGTVEHVTGLEATVNVDALVNRLISQLGAGDTLDTSGIYVTRAGMAGHYAVEQVGGHYVIRLTGLSVTEGTSASVGGFTLYGVPKDWSYDVPVTLAVTVTDDTNHDGVDADVATFTVNSSIVLNPEVDTPTLAFASNDPNHVYSAGADGKTITIVPDGGVTTGDADGSEHFYQVVSGVPKGVVVQGGINNGDGSWTLPTGMSKVVLSDHTASGTAPLTITTHVIDVDQNDGHTVSKTFTTTVNVDYGTGGSGGSGTPELTMSATVSGSLTTVEDASLDLGSVAISVGDSGASGYTFSVGGDGSVSGVNPTSHQTEQLGTVSLVVRVPAGWGMSGSGVYVLSDVGGVQTYTVPYALRGGVTLTPPADYAGTGVSLDVRGVVTDVHGHYDTTDTNSQMTGLPITVTPETDGASLSGSVGAATEDATSIPITLTVADKEIQFFSESLAGGTLTVTIGTVKGNDGAQHLPGTLKTGTLADGTVVTADAAHPGTYTIQLTQAQIDAFAGSSHKFSLSGLEFVPEANYSGSVGITFAAQVQDTGTDVETSTGTISFTVNPVIDATSYTVGTLSGKEDQPIALDLTINHQDLAGTGNWGSETVSVVISGVPAGARIEGATNNGPTTVNGVTTYSWTVDRSAAHMVTTAQGVTLKNVAYVSPTDDSSDVQLTVTTYVFEKGVATPTSTSTTITVGVDGVTDGATLNPNNASGLEDKLVAIDLGAQLVDVTGTSELTSITLTGVPAGATLRDADGNVVGTAGAVDAQTGTCTWTLSTGQVASLGLMTGGKVYFQGAANVSGSWTLTAQAFTTDTDGATATQVASNALPFTVTVAAEADAPILTTAPSVTLSEDGQASLGLRADLVDLDSESLSVTITGAPDGSLIRINTGTEAAPVWTDIHGQNGVWTVPAGTAASLQNVFVKPPADYNGSFTLNVSASSTEQTGGTATTAAQSIAVTVNAVNDAPTANVVSGGVGIQAGTHTSAIKLLGSTDSVTFTDVDFNDAGASALLSKMTIALSGGSGLSAQDALALSGVPVTLAADGSLVHHPDGATTIAIAYNPTTHMLTFSGNATPAQYAALAQKVVISSTSGSLTAGTREVTIAAYDLDGAKSVAAPNAGVTVTVNGAVTLAGAALGDVAFSAAGTPVLPSGTIATQEDAAPVALDLDMAGSVAAGVAVTIAGMPAGTVFRDAAGNVVDTAHLTGGQLAGLKVDLPDNWNGSATLTVTATANGSALTETVTLTATAVNDAPQVAIDHTSQTVSGAAGTVAAPIHVVPADAHVGISDVDGSVISGMTVQLLPDAGGAYAVGDTLGLFGHDVALNQSCQLVVKDTGILVSYDAGNHTLSFSGNDSYATYADLAKSVVLSNTSASLSTGTRSFSVTLYDEQHAASQVSTSVTVSNGGASSVDLTQDAHGTIYWNGQTPVLNGNGLDNSFEVNAASAWSVNGNGGNDTLTLECQNGGWTFEVNDTDGLVHAIATNGSHLEGVLQVSNPHAIQPFADGANEVVFNSSVDGSIDFGSGHVVTFHDLDKIHG